jgi:hypothetical protein
MVLTLVVLMPTIGPQNVSSQQANVNQILKRNADILSGRVQARPKEQLLSGGVMAAYMEQAGPAAAAPDAARVASTAPVGAVARTVGCASMFPGTFPNVRVNQDCSFRRQAEETVAINPNDPNHLIAGQNDSRIGFNHCGYDYSFNRGRTWGDMVPPFWQFIMADGHTADACSDPTVAFDHRGNAYVAGILFDIGSPVSAFVVAKSNAALGGTSYHTPAALPLQEYRTAPLGVVASDNDPAIFHDKEFINADSNPASPKAGNVYATWTRFSLTNSPIYFSQSTDGGATWSPGIEISGSSATLCTIFSGGADPNACDQDQGSWPEVGPDGTLYVFFGNGNTPLFGINQWLMVKCAAANNCALPASWTKPVKVADLIETHPFSAPLNGCPAGRQCLPPNGYRVPFITTGVGHVDRSTGKLYFSWSDFRNGGPCATSPGGLPIPPCTNHNADVFIVSSSNGGATWSAAKLVSVEPKKAAQWQSWMAVGPEGRLYVVYYDRQYGDCETSGCNDITLATSSNGGTTWTYHRITTASMPNLTPASNSVQAGFLGDYMWVAADKFGAVIVWADTRPRPGLPPALSAPEEDIYIARFPR